MVSFNFYVIRKKYYYIQLYIYFLTVCDNMRGLFYNYFYKYIITDIYAFYVFIFKMRK